MLGVLDEFHSIKSDEALNKNHGFKSDMEEVQQRINYWKDYKNVMSSMNDFKIVSMVQDHK